MGGPIYIGTTMINEVGELKLGGVNVVAAYVGDTLVFPSTTSTTTTTTTAAPGTTTTTTTTTTTAAPTTTTSTTTTTTTEAPVTTTTTTTTTTEAPTTTTTTTTTTTEAPTTTTSTTTTTTTAAPTTTTSTTTTTTTICLDNSAQMFYDYASEGTLVGAASSASACTAAANNTAYWNGTLVNGTLIYDTQCVSSGCTDTFAIGGGWYRIGTQTFQFTGDCNNEVTNLTNNCTTTTSTTTTTTTAPNFIDILGDASSTSDGSGYITVYATACLNGSQEPVNTNVNVEFTWTGASSSTINGTVTIYSGNSCGSGSFSGATIGEPVSVFTVDVLDPSASGNQVYQVGTSSTHSIPSCSC